MFNGKTVKIKIVFLFFFKIVAYTTAISIQVKSSNLNEAQELSQPNVGLTSANSFSTNYIVAAAQEQDLLAGVILPAGGLPLKYLFIKSNAPIEISMGTAAVAAYNGFPQQTFICIPPLATGSLVGHIKIKAGLVPAGVSVMMGFGV